MENENYLKDIKDIKSMMANSSQFLSLSGLSGVLAGVYALIGAFVANRVLTTMNETEFNAYRNSTSESVVVLKLLAIALTVIVLSIITGFLMSSIKAKKEGENLWNLSSKKLLVNFGIPLLAGGIFALLLLQKEYYDLIAPVTLIFYGLACVNASKNTFRDVRYLGITILILGLLSAYFTGYGLLFWSLGFGVCHIIYGSLMHFKYDR
jgi:hypothetical protein